MKKIILSALILCTSHALEAKEFSVFGITLGQDSDQVLLKAPFLSCGQTNCTFTALDSSMSQKEQPKLGRFLLAGMQVHLLNKKVTYVSISQHNENFDVVRDVLYTKYGKPNFSKKYDVGNGAGSFDNEITYWDSNGVRLTLSKRIGYMDMLTVTIKPISIPTATPKNIVIPQMPENQEVTDIKNKI